jgi:hypothetical protein
MGFLETRRTTLHQPCIVFDVDLCPPLLIYDLLHLHAFRVSGTVG